MKQPKKLTKKQKEIVSAHGLVANNWMFIEEVEESYIKVVNKKSKRIKILDIYRKQAGTRVHGRTRDDKK